MRLFLSSKPVSDRQAASFIDLVGKAAKEIKIALIENAADTATGDATWIGENRSSFRAIGCRVTLVNLKDFTSGHEIKTLTDFLKPFDVIWLGGGNTYYLRWLLRTTHADTIINNLVRRGTTVYGGDSAGAVVAGPTTDCFQAADDPTEAPEVILDGLGLTDIVVIPHWTRQDYASIMRGVEDKLKRAGYKTQPLTDRQALIIDGPKTKIVPHS